MGATMIFTASDLDRKRRMVLDAAKRGEARVRDTDGSHLVMEPAQTHDARAATAEWALRLRQVDLAAAMPRDLRRPRHFGDLTWARYLPDEDLAQMREALWDALQATSAERDPDIIHTAAEDWMQRAQAHARATRLRDLASYGAEKAREHGRVPGDAAAVVRAARRRRAAVTG